MKLTKMQLNRIDQTLTTEARAKVESIKLETVPEVDVIEIGRRWAKNNPEKFASACDKAYNNYLRVSSVYSCCADSVKATNQKESVIKRNKKTIEEAGLILGNEQRRIMDSLYLSGSGDPMAMIEAFKKFKV